MDSLLKTLTLLEITFLGAALIYALLVLFQSHGPYSIFFKIHHCIPSLVLYLVVLRFIPRDSDLDSGVVITAIVITSVCFIWLIISPFVELCIYPPAASAPVR